MVFVELVEGRNAKKKKKKIKVLLCLQAFPRYPQPVTALLAESSEVYL